MYTLDALKKHAGGPCTFVNNQLDGAGGANLGGEWTGSNTEADMRGCEVWRMIFPMAISHF